MISTLQDKNNRNRAASEAKQHRLDVALHQAEHYWHGQRIPASDADWTAELASAKASFLETERMTPSEVSINYQRDAKLNRLKALYAPDFLDVSLKRFLAEAASQLPAYTAAHAALLKSLDRALTVTSAVEGTPIDIDFTRYLDAAESAALSPNPQNGRDTSLQVLLEQLPKPPSPDLVAEITAAHNDLYNQMGQHLPGHQQAANALLSILMPGTHIPAGELELKEHVSAMMQRALRSIRAGDNASHAMAALRTALPKSFGAWIDSAQDGRHAIDTARVPLTGLNPKVPHPAPETLSDYALEQIGIPHLTPAEMADANAAANRIGFTRVSSAAANYLDPTSKAAQILGISSPRR